MQKLSDEDVETIRAIWAKHLEAKEYITSQKELAYRFGVTKQTIEKIVNNKRRIKKETKDEQSSSD